MSAVGVEANFVDVQSGSLENVTDAKIYTQLQNMNLDIDSNVEKNQLTDDTIDNVFSLYMSFIEGNIILTTTEWSDLVTLTQDIDGVRPIKEWRISWKNNSGNETTTSINGQMQTLRPSRPNVGYHTFYFRIQGKESIEVV